LELGGLILIEEIMTHNGDFSASGGWWCLREKGKS
jgi:hypothetical protein